MTICSRITHVIKNSNNLLFKHHPISQSYSDTKKDKHTSSYSRGHWSASYDCYTYSNSYIIVKVEEGYTEYHALQYSYSSGSQTKTLIYEASSSTYSIGKRRRISYSWTKRILLYRIKYRLLHPLRLTEI